MIEITRATQAHITILTPLFDAYRVFYKQESDLTAAQNFLEERFRKKESVVFIAFVNDEAVGFTQLYTTFSSVSLQSYYIVNDLYVYPSQRQKGIGEALLNQVKEFCREKGYKGLALETAIDNPAQKLYEKLDWKKDSNTFNYFWTVN